VEFGRKGQESKRRIWGEGEGLEKGDEELDMSKVHYTPMCGNVTMKPFS
jgi:hypothetical protein